MLQSSAFHQHVFCLYQGYLKLKKPGLFPYKYTLPGVGGGPYRGGPGGGAPWCIVEGGGCKENGNVIRFNINVTQKSCYSI